MNRVKEEPPEDFVLVLPPDGEESSAQLEEEEEEDIDPNCTQFNFKEEPEIDVSTLPPENLVSQKQLKRKVRKAAPEGIYDCDECDRSFSSSGKLRYHQRKVHDEVQVKCEVCGKMCKNQITWQAHKQSHIKVECSICKRKLSKHIMTNHLRSHSTEKPFECDLCEFSATMKNYIRKHIERKHILKKLVNDSKRDDFANFEMLQKLQRRYAQPTPTERKFKCEQCEKSFPTNGILNRHKRHVHTERLFKCPFCSKAFKTNRELKLHSTGVHKRSHTAAAAHSNFHLCLHCQLVFEYRSDLIRHLMNCSKAKPARLECDLCGEIFRAKNTLREHMERKHSSEKKFQCSKCGSGFIYKSFWLTHLRSKVIHKCKQCDAKFSCRPLLDRHRLESHGKVLKCDKCSYQTDNKKCLREHSRSHDAPIACETCRKNFSRKNLKRHQRQQQHGIFAKAATAARAPKKSSRTK